jgi:hypothetical protein
MRNALNKQFYLQLKHRHLAYRNITLFQILEHLNMTWCPLGAQSKKKLKNAYFAKWDSLEHLTPFGKQLDNNQNAMICSDITISNKDKLQFYLEQIYDSNMFDKAKMMDWENKLAPIKSNYVQAKCHFELLVKTHNTYVQNSSGRTAGCNNYKSAANMAKIGDEIKEYIAKLASASINNNNALANIRDTVRTKDMQIDTLTMQLKLLVDTVTLLAKSIKPGDENCKPNCGRTRRARGGQDKQLTKLRNMGGYCWTHRFHPIGVAHDSKNCAYKIEGRHDNRTYNN